MVLLLTHPQVQKINIEHKTNINMVIRSPKIYIPGQTAVSKPDECCTILKALVIGNLEKEQGN